MLTLENLLVTQDHRQILNLPKASLVSGELVAVLGPNGAGKSSLIKIICGEWSANQGQIYLHDKSLDQWHRQLLAKHLGVLPQASQLSFPFKAQEVVAIGATPLSLKRRDIDNAVQQWMQATDTWQFAERIYTSLSGGERQRVQLARVLLQLSQAEHAPLLLLDEPTSAQDIGQQHQLLNLVKSLCLKNGFAVISILHDLNQASRYADKVWLLHQGELVAQGSPPQVLQPETVMKIWGYQPELFFNSQGQQILV
jgi:iron complex transport system ATP-binding protein